MFVVCCSLCVVYLLRVVNCVCCLFVWLFVCCSLFVECCSMCVVRCVLFVVRCLLFAVVCCLLCVVRHRVFVVCCCLMLLVCWSCVGCLCFVAYCVV